MTIQKKRGATKKLGPLNLGSRTISFKVRDRHFTVHENLICTTASLLKHIHQGLRRPVDDGDTCVICQEPLDEKTSDLTFCIRGCGKHLHQKCFDTWDKENSTCPCCRYPWYPPDTGASIHFDFRCDPAAFDDYIAWVYSRELPDRIQEKYDALKVATMSSFFIDLLRLYEVGVAAEDWTFMQAIAEYVAHGWQHLSAESFDSPNNYRAMLALIKNIYADDTIGKQSRELFFRGLVPNLNLDEVMDDQLPEGFGLDIARAMAGWMTLKKKTVEELYREFLDEKDETPMRIKSGLRRRGEVWWEGDMV